MYPVTVRTIAVSVALFFGMLNASAQTKFKPFPADTVQRFIKAYGKDSLIHLLDERIVLAASFVSNQRPYMNDKVIAMETKLYGKHFNLGFDTLDFPAAYTSGSVYRLYGNIFGDEKEAKANAQKAIDTKTDLYTLFLQNMTSRDGRIGFVTLCNYFTDIPTKALDTLYNYRTGMDTKTRIENLWSFTEYAKNCSDKHPSAKKYKETYFSEMYSQFNFESILVKNDTLTAGNAERINLYFPGRVLAYGLYGNLAGHTTHGKDLMYLLRHQNGSDGGWPVFTFKDQSDYKSTIYALWSLCEYRDKIKSEK
jgi:hypothetical protein